MIIIVDYGIGNLGSIANALTRLGKNFQISGSPVVVKKAKALILPGVGAAGKGMENLKTLGLDKVIIEKIKKDSPFLGICLGMQLLFDYSEEGNVDCLGILKGKVKKFQQMRKIPQIGWNQVRRQALKHLPGGRMDSWQVKKSMNKQLFRGIPNNSFFYFVNSYYCKPRDKSITTGETDYGETFSSIIVKGNIVATQFHPEKSGTVGFQLLNNFLDIDFTEKNLC